MVVHEVYDLLVLFDSEGRVLLHQQHRPEHGGRTPRPRNGSRSCGGQNLLSYTGDGRWLEEVRQGRVGYLDWHASPLIRQLYSYQDDDIARQRSIGFAAPFMSDGVMRGGILGPT